MSNLIRLNIQNKVLKKVEKKDNSITLNIQEEIQQVNLHLQFSMIKIQEFLQFLRTECLKENQMKNCQIFVIFLNKLNED